MREMIEKNRHTFSPIQRVYSIDKLRFISRLSLAEQRKLIPVAELLNHCIPHLYDQYTGEHVLVAPHIDKKGRTHYWFTKIEATTCDDYFVDTIKLFNAGVLSYIEIAQDLIFETLAEAIEYGHWFEKSVQKRNRNHTTHFIIKAELRTFYLGKKKGRQASNYVRAYPKYCEVKEVKSKPCYHIEFVLNGAKTINRALNIQRDKATGCYRGMLSPMEMFNLLENRYLQYRIEGVPEYRAFTEPKKRRWGSLYIPQKQYNRIVERMA